METAVDPTAVKTARKFSLLRINVYSATVMLLFEFVLGVAVNLFAKLPGADNGTSLFTALGDAVGNGPVSLTAHALLGSLIVLTCMSALVRAAMTRNAASIILASLGMLFVLMAWISGTSFVGHQTNGASFSMALGTGLALLCYIALIPFAVPSKAAATQTGAGPSSTAGVQ